MAESKQRQDRPSNCTRRTLFETAGLAVAGVAVSRALISETSAATADGAGTAKPRAKAPLSFLRADEAIFVTAATARLIPGDAQPPGAREADVTHFYRSGAWGNGERMYTSGPWQAGTPQQDYQLKFTPAELYRTALAAIHRDQEKAGTPFAQMSPEGQDAYLLKLEAGKLDLDGVPSDVFLDLLLQNTIEGYLSDPIYGGNRDMVSWKAIGFPRAFASWYDLADKHGINLDERAPNPISIADGAVHGHRSSMNAR